MKRKAFMRILILSLVLGTIPISAMGMYNPFYGITNLSGPKAIHFSELIEFLPEASNGWDKEEPTGELELNGTFSVGYVQYTKIGSPGVNLEVAIFDASYHQEIWENLERIMVYEQDSNGKEVSIEGFPALETYNEPERDNYLLYIRINERFIVNINAHNCNKEMIDGFINSIDFKGIAALSGDETSLKGNGKTLGFEAIFAIIGLLAAVYVLRNK